MIKANLILFFLLSFSVVNSQEMDSLVVDTLKTGTFDVEILSSNIDSLQIYYILESTYIPDWRRDDGYYYRILHDSYLMIIGGEVVLSSFVKRGRDRSLYYFYGEIDGLKKGIDENGRTVFQFYGKGRGTFFGRTMSFEIILDETEGRIVHYYNKLGKENVYYKTRLPNEEELEEFILE